MLFREKAGDDLADRSHRRQDHDVDRRVRVEPEHVLEEHRVPAKHRVEDTEVEEALDGQCERRDGNHRRPEDLYEARRVDRPHEQRQPEPGQPRGPHPVDRHHEVQAGQDRREAGDEDAKPGRHHVGVRDAAAVGRVKGPPRIDAAGDHRIHGEQESDDEDVPAEEVQLRKGDVLSRPAASGSTKFPRIAGTAGINTKNTMATPCMVNNLL